ncbi:hypothetical protein LOZ61_005001 [Ophidiomyces ophidiicola]|uniref:Uncharacterized protein n=1 Tax=Ophidiomyces ophidiicola TaxID=1387563 RepID=A0ACB8UR51_9EURO|nr:hypothetical protein LOZ61_005001 [Ophidiomyces ophidiicola]KAI1920855.1 hypothetical protein LOZ60_006461 [Ophidiomyces ophidiicola]KAI2137254.1 hypothetical protein LOZ27_005936 [Ophidiomyces ophidiicola]KAI2190272.1 hypothetical protein LOZ20_005405 [Ophidiomyces ophidiicola]KAI2383350.1 hypothetical protein LOY88_005317 [Ophidiomyces ophidiicola]
MNAENRAASPPRTFFLSPFPSLRLTNILDHGGEAFVLAFPGSIVFKCPIRWGYKGDLPEKAVKSAQIKEYVSQESMAVEKKIFQLLKNRPHQNIIPALMIVSEGIFRPRMQSTLEDRVIRYRDLHFEEWHASDELRLRWASQIISASVWLESLGYSQGDLAPRNLLLDCHSNIKLSDFGEAVPIGGESQCGSPPYVPFAFETRDHKSDQYAIGWVFFFLYKDIPSDWDGPYTVEELCELTFPAIDDLLLGPIIQKCWHLHYDSLASLQIDLQETLSTSFSWNQRLVHCLKDSVVRIWDTLIHYVMWYKCSQIYSKLRCGAENAPDSLDYKHAIDEMEKPLCRTTKYGEICPPVF